MNKRFTPGDVPCRRGTGPKGALERISNRIYQDRDLNIGRLCDEWNWKRWPL